MSTNLEKVSNHIEECIVNLTVDTLIYPILLFLSSTPLIYYFRGAAFPIIILIYLLLSATRNWILFQS